jgi:hypothetical protein
MYVVVEYTTLLALAAVLASLLLAASVLFMMVQEGVATVWRMSRKTASKKSQLRGSGVIRENYGFSGAVIPAKAGIHLER